MSETAEVIEETSIVIKYIRLGILLGVEVGAAKPTNERETKLAVATL